MSQIDKLTFIPNLFWFIVLFIIFYFLIFSYLLPIIYQSLQTRYFFLTDLVNSVYFNYLFFYVYIYMNHDTFFFLSLYCLFNYLKQTYDFRCILLSGIRSRSKNIYYIK